MKESLSSPTFLPGITRQCVAILCVALIVPAAAIFPVQSQQTAKPAEQTNAKIPPDQLDSLVAPIALYPDPLLAQVLSASTYPLEIIQLQQWLQKHKDLKDQALADAVQKQDWDPSVQAMAALPDVVSRLANDIKWTVDLGNAFLAQQSDVMDAVQRMRKKAKDTGNLKTNEQQKVETKDRGIEERYCNRASQSTGRLCAYIQPSRRVWRSRLPVSANLLPASRLLRRGNGNIVWGRRRNGSRLGRRLGLGLRMGRQLR